MLLVLVSHKFHKVLLHIHKSASGCKHESLELCWAKGCVYWALLLDTKEHTNHPSCLYV